MEKVKITNLREGKAFSLIFPIGAKSKGAINRVEMIEPGQIVELSKSDAERLLAMQGEHPVFGLVPEPKDSPKIESNKRGPGRPKKNA